VESGLDSDGLLSRRDLSDFVPEGLTDRIDSTELAEVQAIYRLEQDSIENPSRRGRSDPYSRLIVVLIVARLSDPIIPYLRDGSPFLDTFQAIDCLDFGELSRVDTII
jgi:hypothetical protein